MSEQHKDEIKRQRLVVFLDGTWNNKDDCTNVLNIYNLVKEGDVGGFVQKKMYDEGVGTGVLDSISGGAFGEGLERNVREAYDWLVENFNDEGAGETYKSDEIYIFGFSRGSYTARSLVGFIARCGLLRRGAPIPVNQLWEGYGALEREKQEDGSSLWDDLLGDQQSFRQLEKLVYDLWPQKEQGSDTDPDRCGKPRLRSEQLNATEQLLVDWSRRVKITFVGVFDTVGARGLDALAIPGLRSKVGRIHSMRPSSIIQNFSHALAIDEHRSGFQHTPLAQYSPDLNGSRTEENPRWKQLWFVGAHSNIGGGYSDNHLAQAPFRWIRAEASAVGLAIQELRKPSQLPPAMPITPKLHRDSFAEFAWPFTTYFLRMKRNFRRILPGEELRARKIKTGDMPSNPGIAIQSYEKIHSSVWEYFQEYPAYTPPNLLAAVECEKNIQDEKGMALDSSLKDELVKRPVEHDWPAAEGGGFSWQILWGLLVAVGAMVLNGLFQLMPGPMGLKDWIAAGAVGSIAIWADWFESRSLLRLAAGCASQRTKAFADSIFWTRGLAVALFAAGVIGGASALFSWGWNSSEGRPIFVGGAGREWWWPCLLLPIVVFPFLLWASDRLRKPICGERRGARLASVGQGWLSRAKPILTTVAAAAMLWVLGKALWKILKLANLDLNPWPAIGGRVGEQAVFSGRLFFLFLSLLYLLLALRWVGEPLRRYNLKAPWFWVELRENWSARRVGKQLERLRDQLKSPGSPEKTADTIFRDASREFFWRDSLGFVPAYTLILLFAQFFAFAELNWTFLGLELLPGCQLYVVVSVVTMLADWLENLLQRSYVDEKNFLKPGSLKVMVAYLATLVKLAGFAFGSLVAVAALAFGAQRLISETTEGGWRGALTLTVLLVGFGGILASGFAAFKDRLLRRT